MWENVVPRYLDIKGNDARRTKGAHRYPSHAVWEGRSTRSFPIFTYNLGIMNMVPCKTLCVTSVIISIITILLFTLL